jgi:hypothetical protein
VPISFTSKFVVRRPRALRGITVVLLMVSYLLAGALHGLCYLDVTASAGHSIVTMAAGNGVDSSGKAIAADHHCHGCFSVSLPMPPLAAVRIEPKTAEIAEPLSRGSYRVPGIDTPPPKRLT